MNGDRKYRQSGYQDNGGHPSSDPRERFQPPKHAADFTAPRLPRIVRNVTASRCYSCSAALAGGHDFAQPCPQCGSELHCCRQCQHFEPSTRFQCVKPIPERIAYKDKRCDCSLFVPRVTVARESTAAADPGPKHPGAPRPDAAQGSRPANDARAAFENLIKK